MSISVLGPTFEDLAVNVKKNISNLSYIFVGRSAGYLGGSLIGGLLFDYMSPHLLLGNPSFKCLNAMWFCTHCAVAANGCW